MNPYMSLRTHALIKPRKGGSPKSKYRVVYYNNYHLRKKNVRGGGKVRLLQNTKKNTSKGESKQKKENKPQKPIKRRGTKDRFGRFLSWSRERTENLQLREGKGNRFPVETYLQPKWLEHLGGNLQAMVRKPLHGVGEERRSKNRVLQKKDGWVHCAKGAVCGRPVPGETLTERKGRISIGRLCSR